MDLSCFVRILLLEDGHSSSGLGTGYLLSRDRVLTAGHVVSGEDVVAVQYQHTAGADIETIGAEVVWRGGEDCDVALLCLAEPVSGPVVLAELAEQSLGTATDWESRGWAVALTDEEGVLDSMEGLGGKARAYASGEKYLRLTVDAIARDVDFWHGISGAPVFGTGSAGRLLGVIVQAPAAFHNALEAVPLTRIRDHSGFSKGLGSEFARGGRALLIEELQRSLENLSKAAFQAIADQRSDWSRFIDDKNTHGLVNVLLRETDVAAVLTHLEQAHGQLWAGQKKQQEAALSIERVVACLAPLLVHGRFLHTVPDQPEALFISLPAEIFTLAELVLAASEGHPAQLRHREADYPDGQRRIPLPGQEGFDFKGKDKLSALARHFEDDVLFRTDRVHLDRIRKADGNEAAIAKLFTLVRKNLTYGAGARRHGVRRSYVLYDEIYGQANGDFLEELRQKMPFVHFIRMRGGDYDDESSLCRPLVEILARSARAAEER